MAAKIVDFRLKNCPKARFIGKRYVGSPNWGEWWENGWFDLLEQTMGGPEKILAVWENGGGYIGVERRAEGQPFAYYIGMQLSATEYYGFLIRIDLRQQLLYPMLIALTDIYSTSIEIIFGICFLHIYIAFYIIIFIINIFIDVTFRNSHTKWRQITIGYTLFERIRIYWVTEIFVCIGIGFQLAFAIANINHIHTYALEETRATISSVNNMLQQTISGLSLILFKFVVAPHNSIAGLSFSSAFTVFAIFYMSMFALLLYKINKRKISPN